MIKNDCGNPQKPVEKLSVGNLAKFICFCNECCLCEKMCGLPIYWIVAYINIVIIIQRSNNKNFILLLKVFFHHK